MIHHNLTKKRGALQLRRTRVTPNSIDHLITDLYTNNNNNNNKQLITWGYVCVQDTT